MCVLKDMVALMGSACHQTAQQESAVTNQQDLTNTIQLATLVMQLKSVMELCCATTQPVTVQGIATNQQRALHAQEKQQENAA
jgi:hypothetical protein